MAPTSVADRVAAPPAPDPLEERIVEAMLECIGRWGVAKTTAEDIARTAGVSRATLYRVFPGGKDVAFEALLRCETARFFGVINEPLAQAESLEDAIVFGLVEAARFLAAHAPLQYLLHHEPERVVPSLSLTGMGSSFGIATAFVTPLLRRFIDDDERAAGGADWIVRQFFSYVLIPSPTFDLANEADVRPFVRTYLIPALIPQEQ